MQCFHQPGFEDMPARAQDVFPSIDSTWLFLGMSSANREIWFSEDNSYPNKKSNYTLWVQRDKDGNAMPVKYLMLGYNSLFGSHYDKYVVFYDVRNQKSDTSTMKTLKNSIWKKKFFLYSGGNTWTPIS